MSERILFDTNLYRRDALEDAAQGFRDKVSIELSESRDQIVAQLGPAAPEEITALRDDFCNAAFSATARVMRAGNERPSAILASAFADTAPWVLLEPYGEGSPLGLGWQLETLSPVRQGALTLVLRHEQHGAARVAIRRNCGAPLGVAHTEQLDFMLMNSGGGTTFTEDSIGRVLVALAQRVQANASPTTDEIATALLPHAERSVARPLPAASAETRPTHRIAPHVDPAEQRISFDLDSTGISRLELYDAILPFADRCAIFLSRPDPGRIAIEMRLNRDGSEEEIKPLVRDLTRAINQVGRRAAVGVAADGGDREIGLPALPPRQADLEVLLRELEAAEPMSAGLGFQPDRGPGHEGLRILNILGKGACDSDCLFCCEKFNPSNRFTPTVDATRQLILDSADQFDMLFFASGEPTIHPKLFEYVELAKSVGFSCFGMSSHFRALADPHLALKVLRAGFEYFDISLHAADLESQLAVNPIDDAGRSLPEALKGLANLLRLADALGIRISITHKIVVSRLNVTHLEQIFSATYDRGVRHFILQPVRTIGLAPDRQSALAIGEDEILPYLNELLAKGAELGQS